MKIAVAMSGGVDSTVAVVLLQEQGYDVIGITLDMLGNGKVLKEAKSLADKLNIEHYSFDVSGDFKKQVLDYFVDSYKEGLTPSPCVVCNKLIKFGVLVEKAKELGCDKIATGHYVIKKDNKLYVGADRNKDQTYFLFNLSQEQIDFCEFPLGEYSKPEIVKIAEKHGVKPKGGESQDLCFVDDGKYAEFVEEHGGKLSPAKLVNTKGDVLKEHKSIVNYTIGQRKGLDIGGLSEPLYVTKIDADKNEVMVAPREKLAVKKVLLKDINWLGDNLFLSPCGRDKENECNSTKFDLERGKEYKYNKKENCPSPKLATSCNNFDSPARGELNEGNVLVKLRYRQKLKSAKLDLENGCLYLEEDDFSVAPGQAAVFYDENDCLLGGGFIK